MDDEDYQLIEALKGLSAEEQAIIRPVLERDLEFQRREKQRLRLLHTSVELYKSDAMVQRGNSNYSIPMSESQDSVTSSYSYLSSSAASGSSAVTGKVCVDCNTKLGFILGAGTKCRKCERLVCDSCRKFTDAKKKLVMCNLCFKERELQAASGTWFPGADTLEVSQELLTQMRRAGRERNLSTNIPPTTRNPSLKKRNMTLPNIGTTQFLCVPTEAEAAGQSRSEVTKRFWGGSPSPRSPSPRPSSGAQGVLITAPTPPPYSLSPMHPKEVIGSPSPRPRSPITNTRWNLPSPSMKRHSILLPVTEIAPPTPTTPLTSPLATSPMADARRSMFSQQKTSLNSGRWLLPPVDQWDRRKSCSDESAEKSEGSSSQNYFDARSQPSSRQVSPNTVRSTTVRAFSTGQVTNLEVAKAIPQIINRQSQHSAVSDPLLLNRRQSEYADWEPLSKPMSRNASKGSVGSYLSVDSCLTDYANNNRRCSASSTQSRQSRKNVKSRKMRKSSSRDTDTISMYSSDEPVKISVSSQASAPSRFLGEIQLSLRYDHSAGCLEVHIIQCRSLPHFGKHKPNPYVKVFLFGFDPSDPVLKHKTSARRSCVDPQFDELMKFKNLNRSILEQRRLFIMVWHKDTISHNAQIGEIILLLNEEDITSIAVPKWYQLESRAVGLVPVPRCPYLINLMVRLGFRKRDRERGIGTLMVHVLGVEQPQEPTTMPSHMTFIVRVRMFFNAIKLKVRESGRIKQQAEEEGTQWTAKFEEQNLNDLHLRSLRFSLKKRTGPCGYNFASICINDYEHRKGRSILDPCTCEMCSVWSKFIREPSKMQKITIKVPFTIVNM